jgi:hypothetical protein
MTLTRIEMKTITAVYGQKPEVMLDNMDEKMSSVIPSLALLWAAFFPKDQDGLTMTSGCEPNAVHTKDSLHYATPEHKGRAIDIRIKDVDEVRAKHNFAIAARVMLGFNYDVVIETNHLHIEYDKKGVV